MKAGLIELCWCGPAKFRGREALILSIVSHTMYPAKDVLALVNKDKTLLVDWGSLAILEYDMKRARIPRKWIKAKWIKGG